MVSDDILDLLSSGGCGNVEETLFVGRIPDDIDTGIAVVETGGQPPVRTFGSVAPSSFGAGGAVAEWPSIQIMSRAADYATARARIQDAFSLIDNLAPRTINGVRYLGAFARQSPFDLGRDQNDRSRWAVNFDVCKAVSTSTTT